MFESKKVEKVFLLGIISKNRRRWEAEESLEELVSLSRTAGGTQVGIELTEVREISPATFLGKGTVERLKGEIERVGADLVIFDGELSPAQNKNL
ncbi:MAG: GTPase HflX, partial [bacterium]|nr:GTPase HflX [bacterium]